VGLKSLTSLNLTNVYPNNNNNNNNNKKKKKNNKVKSKPLELRSRVKNANLPKSLLILLQKWLPKTLGGWEGRKVDLWPAERPHSKIGKKLFFSK
jgi:hypothetical protein